MKKPSSYKIENLCIFRLRRSTAEGLAEKGFIELVEGDSLETRYPLTAAGIEFFGEDAGVIKTPVFRREEPERMDWKIAMKLTRQRFEDSCNPEHPDYDPRVYPGDTPPETQSNAQIHRSSANEPQNEIYDPENPGESEGEGDDYGDLHETYRV